MLVATALTANLHGAEPKEAVSSIGMKLVAIRPGSFVMGQDGPATDYKFTKHPEKFDEADWDERPAHRVTISAPFFIGATEVTVGPSTPSFALGKATRMMP